MYYELMYKLKSSDKEVIIETISYDEIINIVQQLSKGVTAIRGILIFSIYELEKFQVLEKNYEFISNGEHFIETSTNEPGYGPDHISLEEISEMSGDNCDPSRKDITNRVFQECKLEISSIMRNGILKYNDGILEYNGKNFPLKEDSKIRDIFDLIFRAKNYFGGDRLTYEQLLEIYNNSSYNNINTTDIKYTSIRDLIKYKLSTIREEFHLEENILILNTKEIIFNNAG